MPDQNLSRLFRSQVDGVLGVPLNDCAELGAALKAEIDRRVAAGIYFGYMRFDSLICRKPA